MASSLRSRLDELASTFASSVLDAIRAASLDELVGETSSRSGRRPVALAAKDTGRASGPRRRSRRLPRRSAEDVAGIVDRIVALVKEHPEGLHAEQIREALSLDAKELPRPLKEALESGKLGKSGQKRATTYIAKAIASRVARSRGERQTTGAGRRARRAGRKAGARKTRRNARSETQNRVDKAAKREPVEANAPVTT